MQQKGEETQFQSFLQVSAEKLNDELNNNLNLRMKYPSETHRFFPSEEIINEILTECLKQIEKSQQQPLDLLKMIVASKICIPLIKILEHPNPDINMACLELINLMIIDLGKQIQNQQRQQGLEQAQKQVEDAFAIYFRINIWMIQNGLLQNLVTIWGKLNEQNLQEYSVCFKIFKIIELLIEMTEISAPILIKETNVIEMLANRILPNFKVQHQISDDNKFIASDILLALLQTPVNDDPAEKDVEIYQPVSAINQLFKCCGIQVLIETISSYQNNLPKQNDEKQFLSNLFDCVAMLLVNQKQTRIQFYNFKGNYLMVSYICSKTQYAIAALKAISSSLIETENKQNNSLLANGIVDDGSLKYLFPILMGQGVKGDDIDQQSEINEHILSILYRLIKNSEGVNWDRVYYKLIQKRFAKLERIFQLRNQNSEQISKPTQGQITPQDYLRMLKQEKLGILQLCDKCLISLYDRGDKKVKQKINILLNLYNISKQSLKETIQTNYRFIDAGPEKYYVERMLAGPLQEMLASGL